MLKRLAIAQLCFVSLMTFASNADETPHTSSPTLPAVTTGFPSGSTAGSPSPSLASPSSPPSRVMQPEEIPPPAAATQPYENSRPSGSTYHRPFKAAFVVGATYAGKSNYDVNQSGSGTLSSYSEHATSHLATAGEFTFQSSFPIGVSFLTEGTRYVYPDGTSDAEFGLYVMPRLAHTFGSVEFWAGVGLGVLVTELGGPNVGTSNGVTIVLQNTTSSSFAWTPHVGIDISLSKYLFIGVQGSYTKTTFSTPFYASSGTTGLSGSVDSTRSWWGTAFRIGAKF